LADLESRSDIQCDTVNESHSTFSRASYSDSRASAQNNVYEINQIQINITNVLPEQSGDFKIS